MYLWKTDLLVQDLKEGKVTTKEFFKYLILMVILFSLIGATEAWTFEIPIMIIFYFIYARSSKMNFIKQYISLSLPLTMKAFVFIIVACLMVGIVIGLAQILIWIDINIPISVATLQLFSMPLLTITGLITSIVMKWHLAMHLKRLNATTEQVAL